jgi:hypothetical protein
MNRESSVRVKYDPESGYDFFVNVDNVHLLTELKKVKDAEAEATRSQYRFGMVLLGLAMVRGLAPEDDEDGGGIRTLDDVGRVCDLASPFLVPMIRALGALEE